MLGMAPGKWLARRTFRCKLVGGAGSRVGEVSKLPLVLHAAVRMCVQFGVTEQFWGGKFETFDDRRSEKLHQRFHGNPFQTRIVRMLGLLREGRVTEGQLDLFLDIVAPMADLTLPDVLCATAATHFPRCAKDVRRCAREFLPTLNAGAHGFRRMCA